MLLWNLMPSSPLPLCRDCSLRSVANGYCAKHQTDNSIAQYKRYYDIARADDPIRMLYRCNKWTKGTRLRVLRRDILCQAEEGCPHAATVADHFPLSAREIVATLGKAEFYNSDRCRGL